MIYFLLNKYWQSLAKYVFPVKNVIRPFMEISCHFMSQIDSGLVKSKPNSMTIPCHLSRFYLFSMLKHDMDFGQVHVMEFPWHLLRKFWDFHWTWCHFGPTAVRKTWENPCHIFTGTLFQNNFEGFTRWAQNYNRKFNSFWSYREEKSLSCAGQP